MRTFVPPASSRPPLRWAVALLCLSATAAVAKIPPPSDAQKAAAEQAAAKSAWTDKVAAYKLCQAQDRVAARYRQAATAAGKPAPQAQQTPPCLDPGAFAAASETRPLESSEAHSPPAPATKAPSSNTHEADLKKESKK